MKLDHVAIWTVDIEAMRAFYEKYFDARSNPKYENERKKFTSYFLTLPGGGRLELMHRRDIRTIPGPRGSDEFIGYAHLGVELGSRAAVDALTKRLQRDGVPLLDGPRVTGDGYYESMVADPEGNRIVIAEMSHPAVAPGEPRIIEPSRETEATLNALLDDRIYEFNAEATGSRDGRAFAGVINDVSGNIIAAVHGHTWGECCYVAHLWVHASQRGRGIGSALLRSAEDEAIRRGCRQALLLTHSFQAPEFYERHGYVRQATIPNYPQGHAQYVYVKRLTTA
jgi:lactoylglutathione lyase